MISVWWLVPICLFTWMAGLTVGVILDKPKAGVKKRE